MVLKGQSLDESGIVCYSVAIKRKGAEAVYRKCATEISVQHQKQVAQSLLELMQKMPYEQITVTELCKAAEVTRRIFYHLFSNKTGALYALIDHMVLGIEGYDAESPDELLRFFRYWKEQRIFLDVLQKNDMAGLLLERMINQVLEEDFDVRYWLRSNGWPNTDREAIIFGFTGLMGLVYSWYHTGYRRSPEEMAAVVKQMMRPNS